MKYNYTPKTGEVKKVLSEPFIQYNKWWVKVEYDFYGRLSETELMFTNIDSALKVDVGFTFDC